MSRHTVTGDDPLVDGMRIAVRLRRDFVVTDAEQLLGLALGGERAQVTFDDPHPLAPGPDCFSGDRDVFALPVRSGEAPETIS